MSKKPDVLEELNEAIEVLSDAEEDVVLGAWLREKRPGRRYVRAGVTEDGKGVEYIDTDPENVKRVATVAANKGTVHSPRALPKPTRKHLADTIERAAMRGDMKTLDFLLDVQKQQRRLKGR